MNKITFELTRGFPGMNFPVGTRFSKNKSDSSDLYYTNTTPKTCSTEWDEDYFENNPDFFKQVPAKDPLPTKDPLNVHTLDVLKYRTKTGCSVFDALRDLKNEKIMHILNSPEPLTDKLIKEILAMLLTR